MRARPNDDVAVVAYDGLTTLEYAIPTEVFGLDRPELNAFYAMTAWAAESGPIRGAFGITVHTDGALDIIARTGTRVVAGWRDRFEPPPAPLRDALRACHDAGGRVVTVCSGAFVLAAAGLLDGSRATTHWLYADDLRHARPGVCVDPDVPYVDEGSVLTSAGSAAGIDACLHLVREDWGAVVAATVAPAAGRQPHRDGGQAQHVAAPLRSTADTDVGSPLAAIEQDLAADHTVASLASRLYCSPRTFARRFADATGTSPGRWLTDRRLARARELLESTDRIVEQIAADVGFGAAVSLRHHFRRTLRTTPPAYRQHHRRTRAPA